MAARKQEFNVKWPFKVMQGHLFLVSRKPVGDYYTRWLKKCPAGQNANFSTTTDIFYQNFRIYSSSR